MLCLRLIGVANTLGGLVREDIGGGGLRATYLPTYTSTMRTVLFNAKRTVGDLFLNYFTSQVREQAGEGRDLFLVLQQISIWKQGSHLLAQWWSL